MRGLHIDKEQMDVNVPYNDDFVSVLSQSVGGLGFIDLVINRTRIQNSFL